MNYYQKKYRKQKFSKAQATIEFVFAFIVLIVMFYGAVKALQWLGLALASPVQQYRDGLYEYPKDDPLGATTSNPNFDPREQLKSADSRMIAPRMKLTVDGQVLGGQ